MTAQPIPAPEQSANLTANDRLKKSWESWFWGSMIGAIAFHFALFAFWPDMSTTDMGVNSDEFTAIEIPPEVEIPPPPEQIARPATPQIAEANISEDITIAPTTFEENPVEELPPPPEATASSNVSSGPTFTPFDVRPVVQNRAEVRRVLEREYPALLKDSGIGGEALVWLYIDTDGIVQDQQLNTSSGYDALDRAALKVAEVMKFSPALNRDKKVAVWVAIPITFTVN